MNSRQIETKNGINILYSRLSREDERDNESLSIENQKLILEDYAKRNGFTPFVHISDDGYSGTNFQRPGWEQLMEMVESGNVRCILLKDLSRMGRDYLRVGLYRERFRDKGVRLIAINDGFDSDQGEDDFTPFREIISEMYARDTSRKITSVLHNKGKNGYTLTNQPIYGYTKDPNDKNLRIIDPEAAEIVKRIFQLTINGKGPTQIARLLNDDKVERPSYYMVTRGIIKTSRYDMSVPYSWRTTTVTELLKKREYMGDLVIFKTNKPSFKSKKTIRNPVEKQLIFEGAMPAIIDRETWELAQKCRKTVRRPSLVGKANPLTGLLYCSDCGAKMTNHRFGYKVDENNIGSYTSDGYECSANRAAYNKFVSECSRHSVQSYAVNELILSSIQTVSMYARENEKEFVKNVREAATVSQMENIKIHKRQFTKNERRISKLDVLFKKLYEDNVTGKITDERFAQLSAGYENEQADLNATNIILNEEISAFEENNTKAENFLALAVKYTKFDELTPEILNEFIDKIIVYEADRSSGERRQRIDIFMNFIGNFKVPDIQTKLSQEEIEVEEKRLADKRRQQKNSRNFRARKKAKRDFAKIA